MTKPKYQIGDRLDSWVIVEIDTSSDIPIYKLQNTLSSATLKVDEACLIKIFNHKSA